MKKIIFLIVIVIILIGGIFIGYTNNRFIFTLKNNIPIELRSFLKKTIFFPFSHDNKISNLEKENNKLKSKVNDLENQIYLISKLTSSLEDSDKSLPIISEDNILSESEKSYTLKKYLFTGVTPWQYNLRKPVGYITEYEENLIFLSGEGDITYLAKKDLNEQNSSLNLKYIKNNFKEIVQTESKIFKKGRESFRGIMINDNHIYISYYKMIENGCYNISILKSRFNFESLKFEDFFSYDECSKNMSNHSGGKMVKYNNEKFFFTTGDAQLFINAQKDESFFGKLYLISFKSGNYELVAKGMRDTQGAFWYKKNSKLFLTEHGPKGGDEINILSIDELEKKINFGWPISTYGELGPTPIKENKFTSKDENNHTPNGFKEPLFWFKGNSVAPSAIINVDGFKNDFNSDFFMSAMGNVPAPGRRSLHHFKYDKKNNSLIPNDIIHIGERIRDLVYLQKEKKIVMILENSPSIAVLY